MSCFTHLSVRLWRRLAPVLVMTGMLASACGAWAAGSPLEDRLAIEQVWARYAIALDTADAQAYSSLFTPDAYLEVDGKPYKGREAIRDMIQAMHVRFGFDKLPADAHGRHFGPVRHLLSNLVVEVKGDRATSESYWTEVITNGRDEKGVGRPPSVLKMGRYEDELIRRGGTWLFSRRIISGDLEMPRPALQ